MNYRREIRRVYPDMTDAAVNARRNKLESFEQLSVAQLLARTPSVMDAVEYLRLHTFPHPLSYMTYGEIITYSWAMDEVFGIKEIRQMLKRRGIALSERPKNYKDLILPLYTPKPLWEAMRSHGITTYKELTRGVQVETRWCPLNREFRLQCEEHGYTPDVTNTAKPWVYMNDLKVPTPRGLPKLIGPRVKALRKRKGDALHLVAKECGMTPLALERLEDGLLRGLTIEQLAALAAYFGVTMDCLCKQKEDAV